MSIFEEGAQQQAIQHKQFGWVLDKICRIVTLDFSIPLGMADCSIS